MAVVNRRPQSKHPSPPGTSRHKLSRICSSQTKTNTHRRQRAGTRVKILSLFAPQHAMAFCQSSFFLSPPLQSSSNMKAVRQKVRLLLQVCFLPSLAEIQTSSTSPPFGFRAHNYRWVAETETNAKIKAICLSLFLWFNQCAAMLLGVLLFFQREGKKSQCPANLPAVLRDELEKQKARWRRFPALRLTLAQS